MPDQLCRCGLEDRSDSEQMIFCDGCLTWFHSACAAMTDEDVKKQSNSEDDWYCAHCLISNTTQQTTTEFTCTRCINPKHFKTERGLKQHTTKQHRDSNVEATTDKQEFSSTINNLKSTTKILKRIPRGARGVVASKFSSILAKCVDSNSFSDWCELFFFTYKVLHVPEQKQKTQLSLTQKIKNNLNAMVSPPPVSLKKNKNKNNTTFAKYVQLKVEDHDIRGAVRILASEDVVALDEDSAFMQLQAKHPTPTRVNDIPDVPSTDNCQLCVTVDEVYNAISSFPCGSAGGLDGLRPQHLKDLISKSAGASGSRLLLELTRICNFLLSGKVNTEFVPYIYGASLIALSKKDGGIRPIAVGCTLRRLVSKLGCKAVKQTLVSIFSPNQLGFGIHLGCEAAVHATRKFIETESPEVILKIDVKNAFNSIERDSMLSAVQKNIPELFPYLRQCYATPTLLSFKGKMIQSTTGCQQGDPAGPAIFSLTIHPIIQTLLSELNLWFLDDGTLGGNAETVINDFSVIQESFKKIGLEINKSKCELFIPNNVNQTRRAAIITMFSELIPSLKLLNAEDFTLLGAPILPEAIPLVLKKKFDEVKLLLERSKQLQPHIALFLIRYCLWIPKFMYIVRCSPLWKFHSTLNLFDDALKKCLEFILNIKFTEFSWTQACLPITYGGLGTRSLAEVSLPAFIASCFGCNGLVGSIIKTNDLDLAFQKEAVEHWRTLTGQLEPENLVTQKTWDLPTVKATLNGLLEGDVVDRARVLAVTQKHSGAWLQTIPSSKIGTLLDKDSLRISVALRLGIIICQPHTCECGERVEANGHHGLSCVKSAGRWARHTQINDTIKRALSTVGYFSILEPPSISCEDGKRADGMTISPWKLGKPLAWDATVTDTLAPSQVDSSAQKPCSAANKAENRKLNKYKQYTQDYEFVAFAVETMGPFSDGALNFLQSLGHLLIQSSGDTRAKTYFIQRISLAIQRGNAASILGTVPGTASMEEIFYL